MAKKARKTRVPGRERRELAGASITVVVAIDSYHFTSGLVTCQDVLEGYQILVTNEDGI
jgi:Mg2+/Co2+ transporter CorC